jgi:hypothetical protein
MITLTARINLISGDNADLKFHTSNLSPNNISRQISSIVGFKMAIANPFIIGASKIGDGSTICDGVKYFIGNELSDEQGNFSEEYYLNIDTRSGFNVKSVTLEFDTLNNRHPKTLKVGNKEYFDDDAIFTIANIDTNLVQITINNWNTPNYPIVISAIYVEVAIEINNRNLISLTSSIFDRGDYNMPSYGIISNTGNIEFNDLTGEIKDYAEQLLLTSDLKVVISLNNTLDKSDEQVAEMETTEWNYDNNNRSVSVALQDDLVEWQDIYVEGINYDPRNPFKVLPNGSMEDLYKWLWGKTPTKYKMLTFSELDDKTKTILTNTKIDYPLLESGKLWEQWVKLCQVCGLYIYKNRNSKTVCSYTYGS